MMAVVAKDRENNLIQFPCSEEKNDSVKKHVSHKQMKTNSLYKENGIRKASPADPIKSTEDFQKMVEYLSTHGRKCNRMRNKTLFILGCSLGLRCGDLLSLNINDVYKNTYDVKTHIELVEEKTHKRNVCKIPMIAIKALKEYASSLKLSFIDDSPLFVSEQGSRISLKSVYRILNDAGKKCGLELHIGTHTMRKTYAAVALLSADKNGTAGSTLETLQMKFNHSDARITMMYCKAAQDKIDEMSDSVSEWFSKED